MQDAKAAADELERCMRELGFRGAMINGHTNGQYLDHPSLYPFWERAQALGALIYLHPADPVTPAPVLDGHKGLRRATWEWTFETGSHALRLVFGGVFDRFPNARARARTSGRDPAVPALAVRQPPGRSSTASSSRKRRPNTSSDNIVVTTSGMCSAEPLACTISALGHDHVMFASDYPFESVDEAAHFIDGVAIDEHVRDDICFNNAAKLLNLS